MRLRITAVMLALASAAAAQTPKDPGIGKIAQVAIVCKDINVCAERWSKVLGQPAPAVRTTLPGDEVSVMYRGKPSKAQVKLTFFKTGDATLELMEPVGAGSHWKELLDKNGEGIHHIAFQVQNLEQAVKYFAEQGMPEVMRGRYDSKNGTYVYLDSEDKLGVTVELLHSDPK